MNKRNGLWLWLPVILLLWAHGPARLPAQQPPSEVHHQHLLGPDTLTGSWFGLGPRLAEHGIRFEVVYTADVIANVSGGLRRRVEYLDNLDVMLTMATEPLLGIKNGTLFLYGLGNTGGDPSRENVGDLQGVSNIEAPNTFKLYEAWYEHRFLDDRLSLRGGLYDVNTEFDVNNTGAPFLNGSHGIGYDFSQSGENGPSIFPVTSLGLRAEARPAEDLSIRAALLDGVPGDPEDPHGTHVVLDSDDGLLIVAEAEYGWTVGPFDGRLAVGYWQYTAEFTDVLDSEIAGGPVEHRGNRGVYAVLENRLYQENLFDDQGLSGFVRAGWADDRFNLVGTYLGAGLVYTGLIPRRNADRLGLAVAAALAGRDSRRAADLAGGDIDGAEVNLELTYRMPITPWFILQPDLQYVINPGLDKTVHNALILGLRFEVVF